MRKAMLLSGVILLLSLTACGAKGNETADTFSSTEGISEEEKTSDLPSEETENPDITNEETDNDEAEEAVEFSCSDEVRNSDFPDGLMQIADMIIPINGTLTVGDLVEILKKSRLNLEYDIPLDGMVIGKETYEVKHNGDILMEVVAQQLSNESFDTTKDSIVWTIESLPDEMLWFAHGISSTEGMTREDLVSILQENGYSTDGSTNKKYHDSGDTISIKYPCSNIGIDGNRKEIDSHFRIDTSTREIRSIDFQIKNCQMDETDLDIFFDKLHVLRTAKDFTPEIKEMLLEDAKQEYVGATIRDYFNPPTVFQDMKLYSGYVLCENYDLVKAGVTVLIYEATSDSGETIYYPVEYSPITLNGNGEFIDLHKGGSRMFSDPETAKNKSSYAYLFEQDANVEFIE